MKLSRRTLLGAAASAGALVAMKPLAAIAEVAPLNGAEQTLDLLTLDDWATFYGLCRRPAEANAELSMRIITAIVSPSV